MSNWNELVKAAMIGTAKKPVPADAFFPDVNALLQNDSNADNESLFLRGLSLSSVYRRSGAVPGDYATAEFWNCPPDATPECSDRASVLLQTLLNDKSDTLVHFWLDLCVQKNLRVPYRVLPDLLDMAENKPDLRKAMITAGGTTAAWLAGFLKGWSFALTIADDSEWHHGSAEKRTSFLGQLRETNPDDAREKLKATWDQETETVKKQLLKQLEINLGENDLPWLESILKTEKLPVRKIIYSYLRKFPASSIVQQYIQIVRKIFIISRGSSVLRSNKVVIDIYPPQISGDEIFESGIPRKSTDADIGNEQAMFEALIANIPPSMWAREANLTHEALLQALKANKTHKRLIDTMLQAAVLFRDVEWLHGFARFRDGEYVHALAELLPPAEKINYCMNHLDKNENEVLQLIKQTHYPLTTEQARRVLRFTSKNPYNYKRDYYAGMVWQFPEELRFELGAFGPDNNNAGYYWNTIREEIEKLLATKEQIVKSFNT